MFDKLIEDLPILTAFFAVILKWFEGRKETESIKEDIKDIQNDVKDVQKDIAQHSKDIANINGKLSK